MKKLLIKSGITVAVSAVLLATAAAVPAVAATPAGQATQLAALQAKAVTQTSARITSLNDLISKVNANVHADPSIKSSVLATANTDVTQITSLAAKIAADTDLATARADYKTLFTTYRVYAVVIPQSRFALAASDITYGAVPRLTSAQTKLSALLAGKDASKSTPDLQAKLADMATQTSLAQTTSASIASDVLAITPADFNANSQVLQADRTNIKAAAAAVKQATADGRAIVAAIK